MTTLVGMLLSNRYRLDAQIGTGGMSTVYRALDQTLERQVAIKLLHRQIADDPDQLERFRREARAVAQLSHPHIVTVIDAGEEDGRPYIVFEHIDGETLKERIRRDGALPVDEAVAYAIEIARALGFAHHRHIVHRDVKPQNVLVDEEGSAKITDFGIARTLDEEGLTADGRVLGTTDYVAPEQALGHDVTGQSDLYSLGIVLFERLTGGVPFKGENQVAVAMKHVREPLPDVQGLRPQVSATLAAVVDRATAKDLPRRYATDEALIADLEEALAIESARTAHVSDEATSVLRTLPGRTQRRVPLRLRHPAWILLGLVLAAVATTVVLLYGANETQRGTGTTNAPRAAPGLVPVSLAQDSTKDYDPLSEDKTESPGEVAFAVDRQPATTWSTETYQKGALNKAGVGLTIDARPSVAARRIVISSPSPGWIAEIYAARRQLPPTAPTQGQTPVGDPAWARISSAVSIDKEKVRIPLDTAGQDFRYYLVWITKLPDEGEVKISEVYLYRQG
jgi:serine/threonine-protein kinase